MKEFMNYLIIDGIDSRTFGLYFELETLSILPEQREYTKEISQQDGVIDFNVGGYGVRRHRVKAVHPAPLKNLRKNKDAIASWLYSKGQPRKIIFGDDVNHYYLGKIYGEIDFECDSSHHVGELEIVCNPPWKYTLDGVLLTPEQIEWLNCQVNGNQFLKVFTADDVMRFVNKGNLPVKPVIKLLGYIDSSVTITCGESSFKINYPMKYDGIIIDCNSETVLRLSDGENLAKYIDDTADVFFEVQPNNVEISVSSPNISEYPYCLTVIIELLPQEV